MPVHYEVHDEVGYFTIDNGQHSFMRVAMYREFTEHLTRFLNDDEAKVGILSGAPGASFCAGDDLKEPDRPLDAVPHWPTVCLAMHRNKPVVGAVDGYCLGGGFLLLMAHTDLRVATPEAKFGLPEIAYGMGGGGGGAQLGQHLPRTIALEMALTGDYLPADQALRYDMVNRVVPAAQLMGAAEAFAHRISRHPLVGITAEMDAFTRTHGMSRPEAVNFTTTLYRYGRTIHEHDHAYEDISPAAPRPMEDFK